MAWITKLKITFQLPGDSLINDPPAAPTQQWTSISPLSANFHWRGDSRCIDSCGNLFHAHVWLNRNSEAKCGRTVLSVQNVREPKLILFFVHFYFYLFIFSHHKNVGFSSFSCIIYFYIIEATLCMLALQETLCRRVRLNYYRL